MKRIFIWELLFPIILFILFNQYVFLTKPVMTVLDKYRPLSYKTLGIVDLEKYVLHAEAMKYNDPNSNRVAFVGSSSVISGINPDLVMQIFFQHGIELYPVNIGQPWSSALELPMLKNIFLDKKLKTVVVAYNTSFFPREYLPPETDTRWQAIRWDTFEFVRSIRSSKLYYYFYLSRDVVASGILFELFPIAKYHNLLNNDIMRFFSGTIQFYDYWLEVSYKKKQPLLTRPRILEKPAAADDPARKWYLDSDTDDDTLGYKSFARFLDLAQEKNIQVIVTPFPDPEFAGYGKYRQGICLERIDDHVRRIVEEHNMTYLPRDAVTYIEATDRYFYDRLHLDLAGQEEYTTWLANKIIPILGKNY
jgi:hypothetical protein